MRIHRLRIENLRRLHQTELSFLDSAGQPRPFTVLVGPNMSGKTSALDALHLAFAHVERMKDPRFRAGFDPSDPTIRPDPNQPISVQVEFSLHDGEWKAIDDLERRLGETGLQVAESDRYRFELRWPPPPGTFHGIDKSVPANASLAFRGRATAKVAKSRRLVEEAVFDKVGGLLYLDQHRSVDLHAPWSRTASEEDLREGAGSRDVLPWLELLRRLDKLWDPAAQGESAWSRVKRLYASLASPAHIDDVKASDEGFDLRLRRGESLYYSGGMSSGEQQILRLVANLVSQRASRSVVLIDELELHLHPSWQRSLVHFCRHGGDDDNQFIVTTHSESILRFVDPADVISLGTLEPHAP